MNNEQRMTGLPVLAVTKFVLASTSRAKMRARNGAPNEFASHKNKTGRPKAARFLTY
jgi:hypothetical protein